MREKLGEGAFGQVYLAHHKILHRDMAVKILKRRDEVHVRRFRTEAAIAGKLKHENIAAAISFGINAGGSPYIVYEFLTGFTLKQRLTESPPMSAKEFRAVFVQLLSGLGFAHAAGLVHRDIKPANVMLMPQGSDTTGGQTYCVKILDFGIAKFANSHQDQALTNADDIPGTPEYMSPEQCANQGIDARADLYSVGCIMYEVLSGKPPFHGDTAVHTIYRQMNDHPAPLNIKGIPKDLEKLVFRLLQKNRDDRPADAQSVIEYLTKIPHWKTSAGDLNPICKHRSPKATVIGTAVICALAGAAIVQYVTRSRKTSTTLPIETVSKHATSKISSTEMDLIRLWRKVHELLDAGGTQAAWSAVLAEAAELCKKMPRDKCTNSQFFTLHMINARAIQNAVDAEHALPEFKLALEACKFPDNYVDPSAFNAAFRIAHIYMDSDRMTEGAPYVALCLKLHEANTTQERIKVPDGVHIADDRRLALARLLYFKGVIDISKGYKAEGKAQIEKSLASFEDYKHRFPNDWAIYSVLALFDLAMDEKNTRKATQLADTAQRYYNEIGGNYSVAPQLSLRIIQIGRHDLAEKILQDVQSKGQVIPKARSEAIAKALAVVRKDRLAIFGQSTHAIIDAATMNRPQERK